MSQISWRNEKRSNISPMNVYSDMALGGVVTRQEAAYTWGKSLSAIDGACLRGKLKFRKALSGGTILISVKSLVDLWGIPTEMDLWECFIGPVEMNTYDAFECISGLKGQSGDDHETK